MKTHRTQYLERKGLDTKKSYGLDDLSKISNIPVKYLQEVYDRGIGAWKENPESVRQLKNPKVRGGKRSLLMTPEQWAYARVYSFLNGGKTRDTADYDIHRRVKGYFNYLRRKRERDGEKNGS